MEGAMPGGANLYSKEDSEIKDYVVNWRKQLRNARTEKQTIWNECWQLYRGLEDWSDKEEWQSKIVVPKAWASVKQATNLVKRFLASSKRPWALGAVNPDDLVTTLRAEQMTDLTQVFMENAKYLEEFAEGLECGFIMGVGVWKMWWGYKPRLINQVKQVPVQMADGRVAYQRQLIQQDVLEGQLFIRAVDPYNFYWLPGSKMNRWVGTVEDIEIPIWELKRLADAGVFDPEKVAKIQPKRIDDYQRQSWLRHGERNLGTNGPNKDTGMVTLTEYYGPIVINGKLKTEHGHVIIANDECVLKNAENPNLSRKPPYVGFSPLNVPFRTEGIGLIEMVRAIDRGINKLANMSVDTLMFRLLPLFEMTPEVYENPEDIETGLTPGKVFRKSITHMGTPGLQPIPMEDISQGSVQVAAQLDRAHQEGALVSEIQQALPRFRGVQTATEIEAKSSFQESFFGNMALDIETGVLQPMVEMASDLIFQHIDTATDPRIAAILGIGADYIKGMSKEELMEIIQGDYKVKVNGISSQIDKAEMIQNLVQFMNLLGQNPEAWMPWINQNELLKRILEGFRPALHDIENIIADPETAAAREVATQTAQMTPDMLAMIPQLVQMAAQQKQAERDAIMAERQMQQEEKQFQLQERQLALEAKYAAQKAKPTPTS